MNDNLEFKCYFCLCNHCDKELFCHWEGEYCENFSAVLDALALIEPDLITDKVIKFLFWEIDNCYSFKNSDDDVDRYAEYLASWFASHDEGEPASFIEWLNDEYVEVY